MERNRHVNEDICSGHYERCVFEACRFIISDDNRGFSLEDCVLMPDCVIPSDARISLINCRYRDNIGLHDRDGYMCISDRGTSITQSSPWLNIEICGRIIPSEDYMNSMGKKYVDTIFDGPGRLFAHCTFWHVTFNCDVVLSNCDLEIGCKFAEGIEVIGEYRWLGIDMRGRDMVGIVRIHDTKMFVNDPLAPCINIRARFADKEYFGKPKGLSPLMIEADQVYEQALDVNEKEEEVADKIIDYIYSDLDYLFEESRELEKARDEILEKYQQIIDTIDCDEIEDIDPCKKINYEITRELVFAEQ